MTRTVVLALAVLMGTMLGAAAQPDDTWTVRGLLGGCHLAKDISRGADQSDINAMRATMCVGYVAGVMDTADSIGLACLPENVVHGDGIAVFVRWAEERPEWRHRHRFHGLMRALMKAYPCDEER